jgi:predicted small metal-binding protein
MRKFECGSVVAGCDGVVTGETDNDVLAAAAQHAASAHGMSEVPDEVVAAIRSGITDA